MIPEKGKLSTLISLKLVFSHSKYLRLVFIFKKTRLGFV